MTNGGPPGPPRPHSRSAHEPPTACPPSAGHRPSPGWPPPTARRPCRCAEAPSTSPPSLLGGEPAAVVEVDEVDDAEDQSRLARDLVLHFPTALVSRDDPRHGAAHRALTLGNRNPTPMRSIVATSGP